MKESKVEVPVRAADLIPLEGVPSMLPTHPDRSTVYRWAVKGCSGVRLRTVSVGRARHTTELWLFTFFEEVAAARERQAASPSLAPRSIRNQCKETDVQRTRTAAILRAHGLSESG
ncbi:MAG: DUF1580 domain-containing protein [Planctomycetes bacterium]|nr:DUF1580 domain-containing protein [Planctomycetota bacterium]